MDIFGVSVGGGFFFFFATFHEKVELFFTKMNLQDINDDIENTSRALLTWRDAYMDGNFMEAILEHDFESLDELEIWYINTEAHLERQWEVRRLMVMQNQ